MHDNPPSSITPHPILFIVGEQAISKGFTDTAYQLAGQPKELYAVPGAGSCRLV